MKTVREIRDPDLARRYVLQGLLLSRAGTLTPARVEDTLNWAMELVSQGEPLPLTGFVGDVGQIASGTLRNIDMEKLPDVPGLDHADTRGYEDYVLGKLYVDLSFERSADAILRYQGRDRQRAIAYLIQRVCERCDLPCVMLSPAVIKGLVRMSAELVLSTAWDEVQQHPVDSEQIADMRQVAVAFRRTGEVLGPEDIFELESGTALAEFGQRVALRQVLRAAEGLRSQLPKQKPRSLPRQYSVASNIMEEDQYPIGGFTSISNRGTIESLVRSELAYIDPDTRPDLFDIKFARNELLYYSRDENQFLRRRLSFVFVLHADLQRIRRKEPVLPYQTIVILLASLYVMTTQLIEWLGNEAIEFHFLLIDDGAASPLSEERELLETLFREEMANGMVLIETTSSSAVEPYCESLARRSLCHTLNIGVEELSVADSLSISRVLQLHQPVPTIRTADGETQCAEDLGTEIVRTGDSGKEESGIDGWRQQIEHLLRLWV